MRFLSSLLLLIACGGVSFAGEKDATGRTLTMANGNKITFTAPEHQTVYVTNKLTNHREEKTFEKIPERPYTLNGIEIAFNRKAIPQIEAASIKLQNLIGEGIDDTREKLSTGSYKYLIANIVIDERGYVAYYATDGIKDLGIEDFGARKANYHNISDAERTMMMRAITQTLSTLKMEPLIIDGKAVPYTLDVRGQFLK